LLGKGVSLGEEETQGGRVKKSPGVEDVSRVKALEVLAK
jgi:hypothetical protein